MGPTEKLLEECEPEGLGVATELELALARVVLLVLLLLLMFKLCLGLELWSVVDVGVLVNDFFRCTISAGRLEVLALVDAEHEFGKLRFSVLVCDADVLLPGARGGRML